MGHVLEEVYLCTCRVVVSGACSRGTVVVYTCTCSERAECTCSVWGMFWRNEVPDQLTTFLHTHFQCSG